MHRNVIMVLKLVQHSVSEQSIFESEYSSLPEENLKIKPKYYQMNELYDGKTNLWGSHASLKRDKILGRI